MKTTFTILLLAAVASLSLGAAVPEPNAPTPKCPIDECNPTPGFNKCDITTSCIQTGSQHHCACR